MEEAASDEPYLAESKGKSYVELNIVRNPVTSFMEGLDLARRRSSLSWLSAAKQAARELCRFGNEKEEAPSEKIMYAQN